MADHKDHGSGKATSRTGDGFGRSLPVLWRDAEGDGDAAKAAESDADGKATKPDCDGISERIRKFLAEARAEQTPRRSSADRF